MEEVQVNKQYDQITSYDAKQGDRSIGAVFCVSELLMAVLNSEGETKTNFVNQVVASKEFGEAVSALLGGYNEHEWSSYSSNKSFESGDPLRLALAKFAEPAACSVIGKLLKVVSELELKLKEKSKHINKILEDWPDSYKKYIPKESYVYCNLQVPESSVLKLIECVKNDEKFLDNI